jgi:NAD(P)-dependent dehydrogenase (short-subunit alcohol dehydrogenase family)
MATLRENLLMGRRIALGGDVGGVLRDAVVRLGGHVEPLNVAALADHEEHVGDWARDRAPIDALVYPLAGDFAAGGVSGLCTALEAAWVATREVANGAMIGSERAGKLLLIAPGAHAGPFAQAAAAGLENLVRTVSVEWARYRLSSVLIAPGERTSEAEIAELSCFLVSEAGGYLSGCRLELGVAG